MIRPIDVALTSAIGLSLAAAAVLASLWRARVAGVRHWLGANLLAILGFATFAWAPRTPVDLVPEIGHFLLGSSAIALLAGFRAFAGKSSLLLPMAALLLLELLLVAALHHGIDRPGARVIVVCCFYAWAAMLALGSIAPADRNGHARYPYLLARAAGLALLLVMVLRILMQPLLAQPGEVAVAISAPGASALFMSMCALILPLMSLAGVAMVHDRMLREMEQEANHDFLTGAWTRRALSRFAEREIARTERSGQGLALLLMDIDRFKSINDEHGHGVGDDVLKDLVSRTQSLLRKVDLLARSGGEEFCILLPDSSLAGALATAERLRSALGQAGGRVSYTVSIGVAMYDAARGWDALWQEADRALYEAKRGGRDRVAQAPPAAQAGSGGS